MPCSRLGDRRGGRREAQTTWGILFAVRTWLKVEHQLPNHPKTKRLARLWGCHPHTICGFLIAFWGYMVEYQPDGDLAKVPTDDLDELAAPCLQRALNATVTVLDALKQAGFADPDGHVHDWEEYTGALLEQRGRDRDRHATRRKIEAAGTLTREDWAELLVVVGHRCAYCGRVRTRLGVDHIQPLSRGGAHAPGNVIPACRRCNNHKQARTPEQAGMAIVPEVAAAIQGTRFGLVMSPPIASNLRREMSLPRVEQSRAEQRTTKSAPHGAVRVVP